MVYRNSNNKHRPWFEFGFGAPPADALSIMIVATQKFFHWLIDWLRKIQAQHQRKFIIPQQNTGISNAMLKLPKVLIQCNAMADENMEKINLDVPG